MTYVIRAVRDMRYVEFRRTSVLDAFATARRLRALAWTVRVSAELR